MYLCQLLQYLVVRKMFSPCSMLNAIQEHRFERKDQHHRYSIVEVQGVKYNNEMKKFWTKESPGLLLYACLHGTVDIVDYFISKLAKANKTWYK